MEIEWVDRYSVFGKPNGCRGLCEGTSLIPVKLPTDDKELAALWRANEIKEPSSDGWHFVPCPQCNLEAQRLLRLMSVGGARMTPDISAIAKKWADSWWNPSHNRPLPLGIRNAIEAAIEEATASLRAQLCICGHEHDSHSPYAEERGACGWRLCCCEKFQLTGEFGDSRLPNTGENLRTDLKKAQDESWENWESVKKWKAAAEAAERELDAAQKLLCRAVVELSYCHVCAIESPSLVESAEGLKIIDEGIAILGLKDLSEEETARILAPQVAQESPLNGEKLETGKQ